MKLTINIVLECLRDYGLPIHPVGEQSIPLAQVRFLDRDASVLCSEVLYVCTASQLRLARLEPGGGGALLCLEEDGAPLEPDALPRDIHCFPIRWDGITLCELMNHLLEIFDRFRVWEQQLEEAILVGKDFQALVDLSDGVFKENFFLIWDASYNVVAHSQRADIPNKKLRDIIERGFFPKEVTDDLAQMGYMKHALTYSRPTFIDAPNYMNFPFIVKTFVVAQRIQYTCAFYFMGSSPSQGMMDLVQIFSNSLEKYILRMVNSSHRKVNRIDQCVVDLIENWRKGPEYMEDRAAVLGLEEGRCYCLCTVRFQEYTEEQALYMRMRMRSICSKVVATIYKEGLVLIFSSGEQTFLEKEARAERFQKIMALLPICGGKAAFSSTFSSCADVHTAYWQACVAMQYGEKYRPNEDLHFYRDHSIYHMIECYSNYLHFPLEKMYFQRLSLLMDTKNYKSSNLYLLRTYLINERNISQTAKLLYMHRNSVIYRIARIRDLLDVDLNNPEVRLRLLISFKILELLNPDMFSAHISKDEELQPGELEE